MADDNTTVDEFIIDIVRKNRLIYDKTDPNYKRSNRKKDIWKMISLRLMDIYNVDMSAENVEKRWSALRDMFTREKRRKRLIQSGSRKDERIEWRLYRSLLFLSSHISHRKTQRYTTHPNTGQLSCQSAETLVDFEDTHPLDQECKNALEEQVVIREMPGPSIDSSYCGTPIDENDVKRRTMLCGTFTESSNQAQYKFSPSPINHTLPSCQFDEQLIEAGTAIFNAMATVSSLIGSTAIKAKNGYMQAIEEGLKHVPGKNRTQCLIEVLEIIKKYEIRE